MNVLNLGAGNRIIAGAVNHDLRLHRREIDVAWDLNDLPWPWPDEAFDKIAAIAVLEHLRLDLIQSVNECWRILRREGTLAVKLPYWNHENSYQDPTHHWRYGLRTLHIFDPATAYGKRYSFYTERKWRLVKGPRLNQIGSSFAATMEVRK